MPQSCWARVTVRAVTPGATYEGQTFDQYVQVVTPDGVELELFDMAPMVGEGLEPGREVLVLVAVDPHTGFASGGTDRSTVLAESLTPDVGAEAVVRPEVAQRSWAAISYRGTLPLLVPEDVVKGLSADQPVTWQEAVYALLGWRPA